MSFLLWPGKKIYELLSYFVKTFRGFQRSDRNLNFKVFVVLILLTEEARAEDAAGGGEGERRITLNEALQ